MIKPTWTTPQTTVYQGDCLEVLRSLPDNSVNCCVTSPPYFGLRDYGIDGQIGLEATLHEYINKLVEVFDQVRRVLTLDGTCWLNLGDTYSTHRSGKCNQPMRTSGLTSSKTQQLARLLKEQNKEYRNSEIPEKNLLLVPHRVAIALQESGWWVRQDIVWSKPNAMPEPVTDRCTRSHEYVFLLTKSSRYYYNADAISEPSRSDHSSGNGFKRDCRLTMRDANGARGNDAPWLPGKNRNARSVWTINTKAYSEAHFAVFPSDLPRRCILAGCPEGGTVLDPFAGSGTTLWVAQENARKAIGIELNPNYLNLIEKRCQQQTIWSVIASNSTTEILL